MPVPKRPLSRCRRRGVPALGLAIALAGSGGCEGTRNDAAPPPDSARTMNAGVPSASPVDTDSALIGRLVDDVAPDSAYLSSWGVYPLERGVGIVLARIDGKHYLLADTLVGYDGAKARWRIRQVQRVEDTGRGEAWVGSCAIGSADASDGTVVARVTLSDGETLSPIHRAWRLDPATWRFRPFPTDSLTCYNEGMGA